MFYSHFRSPLAYFEFVAATSTTQHRTIAVFSDLQSKSNMERQTQRMECQSNVSNNIDLEEEVNHTFLRDVSEQIAQWEGLASRLGLSNAKIHNIKEDYRGNNSEIKYQMLVSWKQKNGKNATYRALIEGLKKADLEDLANEIQDGKYTDGLR